MKYAYEKLYLCIKQYLRLTLDLELQTQYFLTSWLYFQRFNNYSFFKSILQNLEKNTKALYLKTT